MPAQIHKFEELSDRDLAIYALSQLQHYGEIEPKDASYMALVFQKVRNAALLMAADIVENSTSHCDMGPVSKELHCSMLADLLREKATTDQQASLATPQSET
jgi:hypothetical protein